MRGKQRAISGWNRLRVTMKSDVFKAAKLQPRPSDADYTALTTGNLNHNEDECDTKVMSDEELDMLHTLDKDAATIVELMNSIKDGTGKLIRIMCRPYSSVTMNASTMKTLGVISASGGAVASAQEAGGLLPQG
eukprot:7547653-Pyramimonas_sp.AAC.1